MSNLCALCPRRRMFACMCQPTGLHDPHLPDVGWCSEDHRTLWHRQKGLPFEAGLLPEKIERVTDTVKMVQAEEDSGCDDTCDSERHKPYQGDLEPPLPDSLPEA